MAVWLLTTRRIMVDVAVSVGLLKVYCFANYIYFTLSSQAQMLQPSLYCNLQGAQSAWLGYSQGLIPKEL